MMSPSHDDTPEYRLAAYRLHWYDIGSDRLR